MEQNPYDILGIPVNASQRQVREAFIALAQRFRSEMLSDPAAHSSFHETKSAYEVISDYERRCRYNAENNLQPPPPPARRRRQEDQWGKVIDATLWVVGMFLLFAYSVMSIALKLHVVSDWLR